MQEEIRECFVSLREVLNNQEKRLLRQVEAIYAQHSSLIQTTKRLLPSSKKFSIDLTKKQNVVDEILELGKLELHGENYSIALKDIEPYKVEEYQKITEDHEVLNKSIEHQDKLNKDTHHRGINIEDKCNFEDNKSLESFAETSVDTLDGTLHLSVASDNLWNNRHSETDVHDCHLPSCSNKLARKLENDLNSSNDTTQAVYSSESSNSSNCEDRLSPMNDSSKEGGEKSNDEAAELNNYLTLNNSNSIKDAAKNFNKHPKQVEEWLQQILAETEIEPTVQEAEQFSEISKAQLYRDFPIQT